MPTGHLPPYRRTILRRTMLAALALTSCILSLCFVLPGCTAAGKLDPGAVQAQIDTQRATIAQEVARQNAALAAAQTANDQNAAARAQKTLDALKGIDDKLQVVGRGLASATNPDGTLNPVSAAVGVGGLIPPGPWTPWVIGGGLVLSLFKNYQQKQQGDQAIVKGQTIVTQLAALVNELIPSGHPSVASLPPEAKAALAAAIGSASVAKNGA